MIHEDQIIGDYVGFKQNVFNPEFYIMPYPLNDKGPFCSHEFFKFKSDWNWIKFAVDVIAKEWEFMHEHEDKILAVINMPISTDINEAYSEILKYIKWRKGINK